MNSLTAAVVAVSSLAGLRVWPENSSEHSLPPYGQFCYALAARS